MTRYSFDWVDAFTAERFGGNGCVVVYDADGVDIETRMALVRETSLAECAYMVASDKADFGVRYYLAGAEIKMAGHPTIATVASLVHRGLVDVSSGHAEFTLEVGAGVLPIEVVMRDGLATITMTQAEPEFGPVVPAEEIAGIYGLDAEDIVSPPQRVSTGTGFYITVLRDHETLRRAVLNVPALEAFAAANPGPGFNKPFLVTLTGATEAGDTFARLLLPPPSLPEDPFTGSATGCMGAYLWHHGLIETPRFTAEQGHWMGRPGRAQVEVMGPREAIAGVKVGGTGAVLMQGWVEL